MTRRPHAPSATEAAVPAARHTLRIAFATASLPLLLAGCPAAMSTPVDRPSPPPGAPGYRNPPEDMDTSRPFTFDRHNFGAYCYDTIGCRVLYADHMQVIDEDDVVAPSAASVGPDYLENLDGGHIGIANFPEPAVVTWRSKDGVPHEARIDIGEIFKDQIIRHNVPREELPTETVAALTPDIVLVVNDRTVNVYMRAHVATKSLQIPGNRYSSFREDMILAFSRTY